MNLLLRTLLVWLLALAVPAQGAAAATMAFCGASHQAGAPASHGEQMAAAEHIHPQSDAQAHAQSAHGHHDQAPVAQADSADAGSSAAPAKSVNAGKHKCSACASCCSMGSMVSSVLAVPAPDLTPTLFCVVAPSVDAFAVDGPDRPPRIVPA